MTKLKLLRILSVLLALCMLQPTSVFATDNTIQEQTPSQTDQEIEALLDQRMTILNDYFLAQTENKSLSVSISELNKTDFALTQLGVDFLTEEQVNAQFPEAKADKALALSGQTQTASVDGNVQPLAIPPDSDMNTWMTYTTSELSGGEIYYIQRLTAQPRKSASPLRDIGEATLKYKTDWAAGVENLLSSAAQSVLGLVASPIPGASVAISIYDALESFVQGISPTTIVEAPDISYLWNSVTTATFSYVKRSGQSDDYQWLSLICTKTETVVDCDIPVLIHTGASGQTNTSPNIESFVSRIYATPSRYNSTTLAVDAYKNQSGGALQNCVSYIDIIGPEGKRAVRIAPCCPAFPMHCEY